MDNSEKGEQGRSTEDIAMDILSQYLKKGNNLTEATKAGATVEISMNEEGEFLLDGEVVNKETDITVAEVIVSVLTRIEDNIAKGGWSLDELMGGE